MNTPITITPKFQVHIPSKIRLQAGLKHHGRATIRVENEKIIIEPIHDDFLALGGQFKVKSPTLAENIRRVINYSEKK